MAITTAVKQFKERFKIIKGYYSFFALFSINLILLILLPENGYVWGLFCFLLLRLISFKEPAFLIVALVIATVTLGVTIWHVKDNHTQLDEAMTSGTFYLNPESYKVDGNLLSGTVELQLADKNECLAFYYQIPSEEEKKQWESLTYPISFSASMQLKEPSVARNAHQFNYKTYLFRRKIHWTASLSEFQQIAKDERIATVFSRLRLNIIHAVKHKLADGKTTDYLLAILFNVTDDIDSQAMADYQKIGVIHLFSISGMHIHFLIQLLRYVLLRLGISRETTVPILLLSILFYGLVVGYGVGIFRAIVTNGLLLIAQILRKDFQPLDAFAWTLLLAIWINPYVVFSLAFQLSYSLSAVLYVLSKRLNDHSNRLLNDLFLSFLMTTVSFLFLSYHYFEVSWIGLFVNIVFSFVFSVCFFPLFWLITLLISVNVPITFYQLLITALDRAIEAVERVTHFLASYNGFSVVTGRPYHVFYFLVAIAILVFLIAKERQQLVSKSTILLLATMLIFYVSPYLTHYGQLIMLDVGQGDAFLLISPFYRSCVLIDTGGKLSFGRDEKWQERTNQTSHAKQLTASIKAQGVRKLDALILTHSDIDHIGNLVFLSEQLAIDHIYYADGMAKDAYFLSLLEEIDKSITRSELKAGDNIQLNGFNFHVLAPYGQGKGENNDSLVLFSRIGGLDWLFTGDLEKEGETVLLNTYPNLNVDVLKVGHHGSKTSTTDAFINQLSPQLAFVSVGENNHYGHPHADVIDRLTKKEISVFRTDRDGAVHFSYTSDKKGIKIMVQ